MLTLRAAAALLRAAASARELRDVAAAIGFATEPARLDAEARRAFGLTGGFGDAAVLRGGGSLRALLFTAQAGKSRAELLRAATKLVARAPHALWMLFATEPDNGLVLIGAATPARRGARVAALIADRSRILDSDADTLRQLAAATSPDDLATHGRFVEILGRDALTRRFFRKLEECVSFLAESGSKGPPAARREVALLYASRLLFLGFLESKGWLDGDAAFLTRTFDDCMAHRGGFHARTLLPLFFGTLNTPPGQRAPRARAFGRVPFLNGGLFTPTRVERELRQLRFSDEAYGRFLGELLSRYRFTALEETATFEETAVDPEMLGRAFESLMAAASRHASGAYYTPHALVERVAGQAIDERLGLHPTREEICRLRVLDPACGSGAFLVHVLDRLASMRAELGDARPVNAVRRDVLTHSIFGVDVNPTAVWLCQLRLWLSIVVESRDAWNEVPPLPNLDRNIRVGDSLAGTAFHERAPSGSSALRRLRERYARSTGPRKRALARRLDHEERRLAIASGTAELERVSAQRRELIVARRGRDLFGARYSPSREERERLAELRTESADLRRRLRSWRSGGALPFTFPAHFADVAADGGFAIVVGNPPWVRPHHIDEKTRDAMRRRFRVARAAPWMSGAAGAGAGRGFASQVDVAAVFVERSLQLLDAEGVMSLLLPSKLWRSLSAGGMRRLVAGEARLVSIEDLSNVPAAFDAAVYPGLLVASRDRSRSSEMRVTVLHRSRTVTSWKMPMTSLALDGSPGAPWLLLPPEPRAAFELLRDRGDPLSESIFSRPLLGVKCGLNEAFVVRRIESGRVAAANGRVGAVEDDLLRPVLRGEEVRRFRHDGGGEHIVWTHGADGQPLAKLPPNVAKWLAPHRPMLATRSDARLATRWWTLFRTEAAAASKPRVVWADIGRRVRACVLPSGDPTVPLNTCYVARCPHADDAVALCALLNSTLVAAWLSVIAEQARGGYRRYLGWTMALLPIPRDWPRARRILSEPLGSDDELLDAVIAAYSIRRTDVDPLLAWAAD